MVGGRERWTSSCCDSDLDTTKKDNTDQLVSGGRPLFSMNIDV